MKAFLEEHKMQCINQAGDDFDLSPAPPNYGKNCFLGPININMAWRRNY
jgi:hypothetical protein